MSKQAYGHITPELLEQVTAVLGDAANHKYSTSKVYGAHNQVFKLSEKPESCASCLRKRASALKTWYSEYLFSQTPVPVPVPVPVAVAVDGNIDPAETPSDLGLKVDINEGLETFIIIDGERHTVVDEETEQPTTVIFTPSEEGATFGKATDFKGNPAPAYVYEQNGKAYLVSGDEGDYTEVTGEPIAQVKNEAPALKLTDKDGNAVDAVFTSDDGVKGILNTIDGKTVKPGTYTTAEGATYTVQPGGKATLKDDLL